MCLAYKLVFQYTSTKAERSVRIYSWGLAEHGALGERQFLKPVTRGRRPVEYMHRPYRIPFGEEHDVILILKFIERKTCSVLNILHR